MIKLKDMPQQDLLDTISLHPACTAPVITAAVFADLLHAGQTRKDPVQGRENTPYIEHCLRNALRLLRLDCCDIDTIIAAILHDTVEDCAKVFAPNASSELEAREALRDYIREQYGDEVLAIVDAVTNPHQSRAERRAMSDDEKFALYVAKVTEGINQSLGIFLVKLTDYIDNAGSLHHTPNHESAKVQRLARKYLPLVEVFRIAAARYAQSDPQAANWAEIDAILVRIGERLAKIA